MISLWVSKGEPVL